MNATTHTTTRALLDLHATHDQDSIERLEDALVAITALPLTGDSDLDLELLDLHLHTHADTLRQARERIHALDA